MVHRVVFLNYRLLYSGYFMFAQDASPTYASLHDRNDIDCDVRVLVSHCGCYSGILQRDDD